MDERHAQITEGAGLEDSRINTELLEFLSKWSTPFFLVLLILAAGMFGYRKLEESRVAAIDNAFLEYDLATGGGNPAPSTLSNLGEDYLETRSVGLMAKLDEADIYMNAARAGIMPGMTPDALTGEWPEEAFLDDEGLATYLQSAGTAYALVLEHAERDEKPVLAVSAAFGSAAVLGSQGDTAGAKAMYERAGQMASGEGLELLAQVAADRAANIESLPGVVAYDESELPELPSNDPMIDEITNPGGVSESGLPESALPAVDTTDDAADDVTDDATGEAVEEVPVVIEGETGDEEGAQSPASDEQAEDGDEPAPAEPADEQPPAVEGDDPDQP